MQGSFPGSFAPDRNPIEPGHLLTDSSGLVHRSGIVIGTSSRRPDAVVVSISDSCEELWQLRPEELLGRSILELIQWPRMRRVHKGVERIGPIRGKDFRGVEWFVTLTHTFEQPVVHLEPVPLADEHFRDLGLWLPTSTERLEYMDESLELWQEACDNLRRLIGVDRTIAVKFHDDSHGEVIAESLDTDLDPAPRSIHGMHFPPPNTPSSDRLSFNPVRSTSLDETPPALVVPRTDPEGRPWDLTLSPLQHQGPRRRGIMRALQAKSSLILTLSDIDGNTYALGAHSTKQQRVDALTRATVEMYARTLHARLSTLSRRRDATRRTELAAVQRSIVERIDVSNIADSLVTHIEDDPTTLFDLVSADAAIVHIADECRVLGTVTADEVTAIRNTVRGWLETLSRLGALTTDRATVLHPRLAGAAPQVAGLLAVSVGSRGDFLCWVRRASPRTITWFGEDHALEDGVVGEARVGEARVEETRVEETRVEEVTDRSEPWTEREQRAAGSFARDIEETLLRRAQAELAQLALVDALTGLPNRRLLLDRLEKAIGRASRGHHFALLFLDLNDFKAINDRFGHQVGDEVLVETARRLAGAVREGDTVARLAGDEFVVLCEDTRPGEEAIVVERVRAAFAKPFDVPGSTVDVRAAIGVGHLELGLDAPSMLDRADRAMYAAKSLMKS